MSELCSPSGARRCVAAMMLLASTVTAGPVVDSPLRPGEPVVNGTTLRLDVQALERLRPLDEVVLRDFVLAPGRSVDLDLRRRDVWAPNARIVMMTDEGETELPRPDVILMTGSVANLDGSMVVLAMAPDGVNGFIEMKGETYIVSSGPTGAGHEPVIYNLTELPEGVIDWKEMICGTDTAGWGGDAAPGDGTAAGRAGPCRTVDIAIDSDFEFLQLFGGDEGAATAYVATLFAGANDIYNRDVNTTLRLSFLRLWATSADPWSSSSLSAQLNEFMDFWNANMSAVERDLAHLLSGRNLGGGVAFLGTICSVTGYSLSGNLTGFFPYPLRDSQPQNWDIVVFTHELGHNFGAPHTHDMNIDNCGGGVCAGADEGTIMSYCHLCPGGMSNILLHFHPRSISEAMLPYLTTVTCDIDCAATIEFSFPDGLATFVEPRGSAARVDIAGQGVEPDPQFSTITASVDGGPDVTTRLLHLGGEEYLATIPGGPCASLVRYFFSASANGVDFVTRPEGGERFAALVGSSASFRFLDSSNVDTGWTVSSDAVDGQWTRGMPVNCLRADPDTDADGSGWAWLTDNDATNCNSDVDQGSTTLMSPALDTSGSGVAFISYARWYSNSAGTNPIEDVFVVEIAPGPDGPWTTLERIGPGGSEVSGGWFTSSFRVDEFIAQGEDTRVRFIASDLGAPSLIEAGVDSLTVSFIACDAICAADFTGDSDPRGDGYGVPDGIVDAADFFYYLDSFAVGNLAIADLTASSDPSEPGYGVPDGLLDAEDFFYFLDLFVRGCG